MTLSTSQGMQIFNFRYDRFLKSSAATSKMWLLSLQQKHRVKGKDKARPHGLAVQYMLTINDHQAT
jgi:hypothetical protein